MKKKILPWLAAAALYLLFCFTGSLYDDFDNFNVAVIVNGLFGDNNFCPYVHPLLCVICKGLKFLLPMADVFSLTAHILLIAAMGWVLKILWERFDSRMGRIAVAAGLAYLCFGMVLWNENYTVWAAFFSFTGILAIYTAKDGKEGRAHRIVGALFYGFGLMYRWQAAFLALPYIALAVLANMAEARFKKERIKAELLRILPWALVFTGLTVSRLVFYSFEPWKSDLAYDSARVTLNDFPVLDWDELEEIPEGAGRYTYYAASRWLYADTEALDLESIREMAEKGKTLRYAVNPEGIAACLRRMVREVFENGTDKLFPLILLIILCFCSFSGHKAYDIERILIFGGSFLILFYYTLRGRAYPRVWQSVLLAAFSVLLARPGADNKEQKIRKMLPALISAVILILACFGEKREKIDPFVNVITADAGADDGIYSDIYESGQIWLVGGWIRYKQPGALEHIGYGYGLYTLEKVFFEQGKLPTKRFFRSFIPCASFWFGQEYYRSMLKELGMENPVKALITEDRCRLWDRSEDSLFRETFFVYLYRRYGDMDVIKEKTVLGYPLYRFEQKEGGEK